MKPFYWLAHSLAKFSARLFYNYEVIHPERLIEHGPCLIASNHESFLDPPYVSIAFKRSIYFLARKTLFDNPLFGGAIRRLNAVPVDQDRPDMSSLKRIIKILRSGERVLIFPEGERTLTGNFGPAERGVGLVIAKSQAPVLPVRIFGAYEAFPRGATVPKLGKITVVIGEPLDFSQETPTGDKKEFYQSLSDRTLEAIAKLEIPKTFPD